MIKNYSNYNKTKMGKTTFNSILDNLTYARSTYYDKEKDELFCYGNELFNLEGIDFYPNVKIAHLKDNNLDNLNGIQDCKKLEVLNCSVNNLTNLEEISNLKSIKALNADFNLISDLTGVMNLFNLEGFYCQNNLLKNLEFGEISIDAFELGIDKTNLNRFKKLKILTCYNNLFSYRYEKYIKNYCLSKNIYLNVRLFAYS